MPLPAVSCSLVSRVLAGLLAAIAAIYVVPQGLQLAIYEPENLWPTNGGIFPSSSPPYWLPHQPVLTRGIHIDCPPNETAWPIAPTTATACVTTLLPDFGTDQHAFTVTTVGSTTSTPTAQRFHAFGQDLDLVRMAWASAWLFARYALFFLCSLVVAWHRFLQQNHALPAADPVARPVLPADTIVIKTRNARSMGTQTDLSPFLPASKPASPAPERTPSPLTLSAIVTQADFPPSSPSSSLSAKSSEHDSPSSEGTSSPLACSAIVTQADIRPSSPLPTKPSGHGSPPSERASTPRPQQRDWNVGAPEFVPGFAGGAAAGPVPGSGPAGAAAFYTPRPPPPGPGRDAQLQAWLARFPNHGKQARR